MTGVWEPLTYIVNKILLIIILIIHIINSVVYFFITNEEKKLRLIEVTQLIEQNCDHSAIVLGRERKIYDI